MACLTCAGTVPPPSADAVALTGAPLGATIEEVVEKDENDDDDDEEEE